MNAEVTILLGAEKQAATSIALAYPQKTFIGITDVRVVDGWDVPNLQFQFAKPGEIELATGAQIHYLCQRYAFSNSSHLDESVLSLSQVSAILKSKGFHEFLYVERTPNELSRVKGDLWRKPNQVATATQPDDIVEEHSGGYVFQRLLKNCAKTYIVTGNQSPTGCVLGVVEILREGFSREQAILAAQVVRNDAVKKLVKTAVGLLELRGTFTATVVETHDGALCVTSVRRTIRGVANLLLKSGMDVLHPELSRDPVDWSYGHIAVMEHHYSTYQELPTT